MDLMLSGRLLNFDDARSKGLIHELIDADNFAHHVREYVKRFIPPQSASMAVAHIKRSLQSGENMSLSDHLALERELQQRLFESNDAHEGIEAYLKKRPAHFSGN